MVSLDKFENVDSFNLNVRCSQIAGLSRERLSQLAAAQGRIRVVGEAGDEEDEDCDGYVRFARPHFAAFDDDGNLAVIDKQTSCIKVIRYLDGMLLLKIGCFGK